ncbi:galactokinase [Rothia kristinae]|uniref:Galactokinase n=1 Tax=Rothia kristinae TaxID=37923 RepID=A0A199NTH5_9MICC|nr:galactokinase family protein [Rothia kristinae]OAX52384.1 galactokinase [Rothia kristinae]
MPQSPQHVLARWAQLPDHEQHVRTVTRAFRERYGQDPDGVWSAPGRLNLLGEYVDFNGGCALPTPLPYRTLIAARLRTDGVLHAESLQLPGAPESRVADIAPGTISGWFSYVGGVAWALNREGGADLALPPDFGADLLIDSTVPVGGGLSSSAALLAATALTLLELSCPLRAPAGLPGLPVGGCSPDDDALRARLAQVCITAENRVAGARTGGLDQTAALRSLPGQAVAIDFRDFSLQPVPVDAAAAGLAFLVIDTNAPHDLADGQYSTRRQACETVARAVGVEHLRDLLPEDLGFPELAAPEARRAREAAVEAALDRLREMPGLRDQVEPVVLTGWVRHVFTDMALVERARALFTRRFPADPQRHPERVREVWEEFGKLFTTSHASMRDDLQASRRELDVAVDTCLEHGALGARLVGGGFGGAVLALVEADRVQATAQAVAQAFAARDFAAPVFLPLAPGRPAHRDR